jgi:hypothetical protein
VEGSELFFSVLNGRSSIYMNVSLIAHATCFPLVYKYSGTSVYPGATLGSICEGIPPFIVEFEATDWIE